MGKDNGNTTNSWLNLPKILEMTLTGGVSTVTGEKLVDIESCSLENIREGFYKNVQRFVDEMAKAANGASRAISTQRVPFLSCLMGGLENGIDARDIHKQGTKYNAAVALSMVFPSLRTALPLLISSLPRDRRTPTSSLMPSKRISRAMRSCVNSCSPLINSAIISRKSTAKLRRSLQKSPISLRVRKITSATRSDPTSARLRPICFTATGRRNSRRQKLQRYARLRRGSALRQR